MYECMVTSDPFIKSFYSSALSAEYQKKYFYIPAAQARRLEAHFKRTDLSSKIGKKLENMESLE